MIICTFEGCNFKSDRSHNIKSHLAEIHGVKVEYYSCGETDCMYKAKRASNLKKHKAVVHSIDVVWHQCFDEESFCTYKTKNKSNLDTHIKNIHGISELFLCREIGCNYFGKDAGKLKTHKANVHEISTIYYDCNEGGVCEYRCRTKGNLKRHVERNHRNNFPKKRKTPLVESGKEVDSRRRNENSMNSKKKRRRRDTTKREKASEKRGKEVIRVERDDKSLEKDYYGDAENSGGGDDYIVGDEGFISEVGEIASEEERDDVPFSSQIPYRTIKLTPPPLLTRVELGNLRGQVWDYGLHPGSGKFHSVIIHYFDSVGEGGITIEEELEKYPWPPPIEQKELVKYPWPPPEELAFMSDDICEVDLDDDYRHYQEFYDSLTRNTIEWPSWDYEVYDEEYRRKNKPPDFYTFIRNHSHYCYRKALDPLDFKRFDIKFRNDWAFWLAGFSIYEYWYIDWEKEWKQYDYAVQTGISDRTRSKKSQTHDDGSGGSGVL